MKHLILSGFIILSINAFGQSQKNQIEIKADSLLKHFRYVDAALLYSCAAESYENNHNWVNSIRNYRSAGSASLKSARTDESIIYIEKAWSILEAHVKEDPGLNVERVNLLLEKAKFAEKKWKFQDEMQLCRQALAETCNEDSCLLAEVWSAMGTAFSNKELIDSAIYLCQKSLYTRIRNLGENTTNVADCYFTLGNLFLDKQNTNKALENLQKALQIRIKISGTQHPAIALCYNSLGLLYYSMAKYDTALNLYNKALQINTDVFGNQDLSVAQIYQNMGLLYLSKTKQNIALEYLQKALIINRKIFGEYDPETANNYSQIGRAYLNTMEYDTAIYYYQKALPTLVSILGDNHFKFVASCYNGLGLVYSAKNEDDKAFDCFQKALQIQLAIFGESRSTVAITLSNIGLIYFKKSDFERALTFYQKALQIKITISGQQHPSIATCYTSIGNVYYYKRLYNEAMSYFQKALQILNSVNGDEKYLVANDYNKIGNTYREENNWSNALFYQEKALQIQTEFYGACNLNVAYTYRNIGLTYCKKGDYDKAVMNYEKCLQIATKISGQNHTCLIEVYNGYGDIFYKKGDYDKALSYYQKSIMTNVPEFKDSSIYSNPTQSKIYYKDYLVTSLTNKANSFYNKFKKTKVKLELDASLSAFESVIQIIHSMRNEFSSEKSKFQLNDETKETYAKAVHVALEGSSQMYKNKAFEFIEKGKGDILKYDFSKVNRARLAGIPDSLMEQEKVLRQTISKLSVEIDKEKQAKGVFDSIKINSLENKTFVCNQRLDSLILFFEKAYPLYNERKYTNKSISLEEIKKKIDNNTALLNYFIGDSSLFIAIITDSLYEIKEIKIDSTFKKNIIAYCINLKKSEEESFATNSLYIYNKLIKPIESFINNKKKLIIFPDEYLFYLPFETLIKDESSITDFSGYHYLIKKYTISYHYSATIWLNSLEKESVKSSQYSFVGFAPIFSPENNNDLILSSKISAIDLTGDMAYRSTSNSRILSPLPYSKDEVTSIFHLFEKQGKKARAFLYSEANEYEFKHSLGEYNIVHISTHGFSNDKIPNLSGIVFSQPTDTIYKHEWEDGILYAGEVYNLNLKADLVVLSSCESGLGKLVRGEGLQALSKGFIYAGSSNIIFSLWKVMDKPTKDLMVNFYTKVLEGEPYANALRIAKLGLINDPKTAFPHFWSNFLLIGR